jgi:hypothetical protein
MSKPILGLDFSLAKNSELIFTQQGRHLASSVHPTREAHQWVAHHEAQWKDAETILVLGIGCGYHLRALASTSKKRVIGCDINKDFVRGALRIHPLDLKESEMCLFENLNDLEHNTALTKATQTSYAVLVHEASVFANRPLFQEAQHFLLGRTRAGLQWLFANRGLGELNFQEEQGANLLSLKSIDSVLEDKAQAPLLNALRELIA